MIKRHIIETVEAFNESGALINKITTETDETDDNDPVRFATIPYAAAPTAPSTPPGVSPWWGISPPTTCDTAGVLKN